MSTVNETEAEAQLAPALTVSGVRAEVLAQIEDVPDGDALDDQTRLLVALAVRACATTLDLDGTREYVARALEAGVTAEQIQETFLLISGIGLHCLLACSGVLKDRLIETGDERYASPLEGERAALASELAGDDEREARTSKVAPGFVDNLLRLSNPDTVRAVFAFRAAPWGEDGLTRLQKECVGIAVDTMDSHRFLPTLRLHVENTVALGAGKQAITDVLDIAGAAPPHRGVW